MNLNRLFAIIGGLLAVAAIFYYFSNIVVYVVLAWIVAMIGQPIMLFFFKNMRLARLKSGRNISAILTLFCFFIFFVFLLSIFVPLIAEQASNLSRVDYAATMVSLQEPVNHLNMWLREKKLLAPDGSVVTQLEQTLIEWYNPAKIGNMFRSLVQSAGQFVITISSASFIAFFFLKDQEIFTDFFIAIFPKRFEDNIRRSFAHIRILLSRYFSGLLIQMFFFCLIITIGLTVIGAKNALLIGFLAALLNVVPYVGPIIGGIFTILITISSNLDLNFYDQMLPLLTKILFVFPLAQFIDGMIVQPTVFSKRISAHPLEIFLIILVGADLGGILGMVLAIPVYTIVRVIAREFWSEYSIVQKLTDKL